MDISEHYKKPNFTGRRFVVADIHGSYRGLKQVLEKVSFDYENDLLIQLGDVVDGWSESKECIDELLKIKHLVHLLGNHDEWASKYYNGKTISKITKNPKIDSEWYSQGGESTLNSLGTYFTCDKKYVDFLNKGYLFCTLQDSNSDKKMLFVHGNVPEYDFESYYKNRPDLLYTPEFIWYRKTTQEVFQHGLYSEYLSRYKEIYLGHTGVHYFTQTEYEPLNKHNIWLLDTGAATTGKVTILNLDTKKYEQSDICTTLYPDELGRNQTILQ